MKKIIISALVIILAVLFVPVPGASYDDGGTREFKALTYKIVKWNRIYEGDLCYNLTRFYRYPESKKSIDELWKDIDTSQDGPNSYAEYFEFSATVLEVEEERILVEPAEGTRERNSSDKIYVSLPLENTASDFAEGDAVNISYNGVIQELYPAIIPNADRITVTGGLIEEFEKTETVS